MSLLDELASSQKLRRQMREAISRSKNERVEMAFPICANGEGIVAGEREMTKGTEMQTGVIMACPATKGDFLGSFHCIPSSELVFVEGRGPMPAEEAMPLWPKSSVHLAPEILRIDMGLGRILSVTPNHPVFTDDEDGWKEAGRLRLGDRVYANPKIPLPLDEPTIAPPPPALRAKSIRYNPRVPTRPTEDLMEFLGLIWSDGNLTKQGYHGGRIMFANNDMALIDRFCAISEDTFGLTPRVTRLGTGYQATICSTILHGFLVHSLGFTKKRIPSIVWRATAKMASAFLRGVILGDGSTGPISPEAPSDIMTAISTGADPSPAYHLAYLLSALGKKARVRKMRQNWPARNYSHMYQVAFQESQGKNSTPWTRIITIERILGPISVYDFETSTGTLICGRGPLLTHNTHVVGVPYPSRLDILNMGKEKVTCTGQDNKITCLSPKPGTGPAELKATVDDINYYTTPWSLAPEARYWEAVKKRFDAKEFEV